LLLQPINERQEGEGGEFKVLLIFTIISLNGRDYYFPQPEEKEGKGEGKFYTQCLFKRSQLFAKIKKVGGRGGERKGGGRGE